MLSIVEIAISIEEMLHCRLTGLNVIVNTNGLIGDFSLGIYSKNIQYEKLMIFTEQELRDFYQSFPEHERLFLEAYELLLEDT